MGVSTKYFFVLLLVVRTIPNTMSYFTGTAMAEINIREICWEDAITCGHWSGDGIGVRSRFCWKRCICKGYKAGSCHKNLECMRTTPKRPWKCECWNKADTKTFRHNMKCFG